MLKLQINSLDDVAEGLRSLYTKVGDVFMLETDDSEMKDKISEFRNNNIDLQKQLAGSKDQAELAATLQKQLEAFGNMNPEEASAAIKQAQDLKDKQLIDAGEIDAVVAQRVETQVKNLVADHNGKVNALQSALDKATDSSSMYKNRLGDVVIDSTLQKAINSVGNPRQNAMVDLIARGKGIFSLNENGETIPMSGETVVYGKDGKTPLTMNEWAQTQLLEAPFLFEGSAGGGSAGGSGDGASGGVVDGSNTDALSANLEDIAAGKVSVQMPS